MHVQAIREFYARDANGSFLMKSDPDFWNAAEKALVAKVQLEAHASGADLTDQQIRNAATSYYSTILVESVCACMSCTHVSLCS